MGERLREVGGEGESVRAFCGNGNAIVIPGLDTWSRSIITDTYYLNSVETGINPKLQTLNLLHTGSPHRSNLIHQYQPHSLYIPFNYTYTQTNLTSNSKTSPFSVEYP